MKKIWTLIIAMTMILGCAALTSCGDSAEYTVGIVQHAPHPALDAATLGFKEQLEKELGEGKVKFIEHNAQNDAATSPTLVNDLITKNVDLILANATPSLTAAVNATETIPILGTSITEYGSALKIDNFTGVVGSNVSGTSDLAPLDQQAQMVKDLFPNAQTVALLYCSAEPNSDYQVKVVEAKLTELGFTCEKFSFTDSNDVATVAAAAAAKDVIYIPTDNTAANCTGAISGAIGDTPVIAGEQGICKGCGVATLSIDYYDLGVATGKMAAKILKGEAKIEEMPIEYAAEFTKMYNAARCAELNIDTAALEAAGYVAIPTES